MGREQVTRGYGMLEGFLARQRAAMANCLIPPACRAGRILDLGCGTQPYFLQHTDAREKYGLDQVLTERRELPSEEGKITLLPFDLRGREALPFPNGFFAAVTMLAVIEHLPRSVAEWLGREVYRVLQPAGVFVLTTPAPWSEGLLKLMAAARLVSHEELDEHQDIYGRRDLCGFLRQAGFADDHIQTGFFELGLNLWATATH